MGNGRISSRPREEYKSNQVNSQRAPNLNNPSNPSYPNASNPSYPNYPNYPPANNPNYPPANNPNYPPANNPNYPNYSQNRPNLNQRPSNVNYPHNQNHLNYNPNISTGNSSILLTSIPNQHAPMFHPISSLNTPSFHSESYNPLNYPPGSGAPPLPPSNYAQYMAQPVPQNIPPRNDPQIISPNLPQPAIINNSLQAEVQGPRVDNTKATTRYSRILNNALHLEPAENRLHWVNFSYKTIYPSKLTIHYLARETFDKVSNSYYFTPVSNPAPKSQCFDLEPGNEIPFIGKYKAQYSTLAPNILEVADKVTYPIVIEINCKNPSCLLEVQVLISCFKITIENNSLNATLIKQMIRLNDKYRTITNIYGTSNNENEQECLICLTDRRVIAVLPCNHVCYCEICIEEIKTKPKHHCPVCRAAVTSFLKVSH